MYKEDLALNNLQCLIWRKTRQNLAEPLKKPQLLLSPVGAIFGVTNSEMTNTMTSHMPLFKGWEEEQVKGEFTKDKKFTEVKRKN